MLGFIDSSKYLNKYSFQEMYLFDNIIRSNFNIIQFFSHQTYDVFHLLFINPFHFQIFHKNSINQNSIVLTIFNNLNVLMVESFSIFL